MQGVEGIPAVIAVCCDKQGASALAVTVLVDDTLPCQAVVLLTTEN